MRSACGTLDAKFDQYRTSERAAERKALAEQIQREILENYNFVPVFRHAFIGAIGSRIAATIWQRVFPTITTGYAYPWETPSSRTSAGSLCTDSSSPRRRSTYRRPRNARSTTTA
jgi:hypothetical protein